MSAFPDVAFSELMLCWTPSLPQWMAYWTAEFPLTLKYYYNRAQVLLSRMGLVLVVWQYAWVYHLYTRWRGVVMENYEAHVMYLSLCARACSFKKDTRETRRAHA